MKVKPAVDDGQTYYETSDTFLSAFLLTMGMRFRNCYENEEGRVVFQFVPSGKLIDLIDGYRGNDEAPARELLHNYRFLINEVHQSQDRSERS